MMMMMMKQAGSSWKSMNYLRGKELPARAACGHCQQ